MQIDTEYLDTLHALLEQWRETNRLLRLLYCDLAPELGQGDFVRAEDAPAPFHKVRSCTHLYIRTWCGFHLSTVTQRLFIHDADKQLTHGRYCQECLAAYNKLTLPRAEAVP